MNNLWWSRYRDIDSPVTVPTKKQRIKSLKQRIKQLQKELVALEAK